MKVIPMKTKDVESLLEDGGFCMIRNGAHKIYQKDNVRAITPHSKTMSTGLVQLALKALRKAA